MDRDDLLGAWLLGMTVPSELRKLMSEGLAVEASSRFVIPILHAHTLDEYLKIIEDKIGTENELVPKPYYLRGQTRDHFPSGNRLEVLPPAYRSLEWRRRYISEEKSDELQKFISPWLDCLRREMEIEIGPAYFQEFSLPGDPPIMRRFAKSSLPSDLVINNPGVMAVLQHYGFPTPCLDVTRSPIVALWFALHRSDPVSEGVRAFRPVRYSEGSSSDSLDSLWEIPSVHIFREPPPYSPVIDYGEYDWLNRIAIRPSLQFAASLPFRTVGLSIYPSAGVYWARYPKERSPVGVIKIHFLVDQLRARYPNLSQESLFPNEDHLHKAFCRVCPPYFIRYVSRN